MIINFPNFDSTPSLQDGEFQKLPAGGYVCIITGADVSTSKSSGLKQLVLEVEIAEGDFAGYFKKDKYKPQYYKTIFTKEGKFSPYLKGVLMNIENSNSDFKAAASLNTNDLIGKKVGMVFREEDVEKNGKIYTNINPRIAKTVDEIRNGNFTVPPAIKINKPSTTTYSAADYQPSAGIDSDSLADENMPF